MSGFSCELFFIFDLSYLLIILTEIKLNYEYLFKYDVALLKDWILDLDYQQTRLEYG